MPPPLASTAILGHTSEIHEQCSFMSKKRVKDLKTKINNEFYSNIAKKGVELDAETRQKKDLKSRAYVCFSDDFGSKLRDQKLLFKNLKSI